MAKKGVSLFIEKKSGKEGEHGNDGCCGRNEFQLVIEGISCHA